MKDEDWVDVRFARATWSTATSARERVEAQAKRLQVYLEVLRVIEARAQEYFHATYRQMRKDRAAK